MNVADAHSNEANRRRRTPTTQRSVLIGGEGEGMVVMAIHYPS